jgi:hypothetical protein
LSTLLQLHRATGLDWLPAEFDPSAFVAHIGDETGTLVSLMVQQVESLWAGQGFWSADAMMPWLPGSSQTATHDSKPVVALSRALLALRDVVGAPVEQIDEVLDRMVG